jgi:hypothetical protein
VESKSPKALKKADEDVVMKDVPPVASLITKVSKAAFKKAEEEKKAIIVVQLEQYSDALKTHQHNFAMQLADVKECERKLEESMRKLSARLDCFEYSS